MVPPGDDELAEAVADAMAAEAKYEIATLERTLTRQRVVELLRARGEKSTYTAVDGRPFKVTVVAGERTRVDEEGLVKAIGKRAFNKLTVARVDPKKVEWAIKNGKLDLEVAAPYISIVPTSAFPKITEVEDDE